VGDTAAYFVGRGIGRWKMTPHISPNKTWEGAAANFLGALLVAAVFGYWAMGIPPAHMLAMAAVGSAAGQIGDLFESSWKRSAGVKDSGSLLPGHGGLLDRVDSALFTMPVVYAYLRLVR
jgi:phosphatidate cytidylyltransferase